MGRLMYQPFLILVLLPIIFSKIIERNETQCTGGNQPIECSWNYLAYFPRKFVAGTTENFMVSIHGYQRPVDVNITLRNRFEKNTIYTSVSKTVQPEVLTKIPVYIGHDSPDVLEVFISGLGELYGNVSWAFQNKSTEYLNVLRGGGVNLFIQTDRPMYKPKQTIKFRVFAVDSNLRSSGGQLDKVVILNPSGSRMRQWNNVNLTDSYASFELKTSEKPVLGKWKIEAFHKSYKKSLQIELAKFVLPKFQVTITPPSYITKETNSVDAEICAKYSYGKAVFGKLSAKICYKKHFRHYWYWRGRDEDKETCETISKKIHGCTTVSMDITKNQQSMKDGNDYVFTFEGDVKEKATGIQLSAKKVEKQTTTHKVKITFETENMNSYKPGFPLAVKILTKAPDGTLIPKVSLKLKVLDINKTITTTNGVYILQLGSIPIKTRALLVQVSEESNRFNNARLKLRPWYSPSHSYIQMEKMFKGEAKIGNFVDMKIHYTSVDPFPTDRTVYYSIICAGNIVDSGSFVRNFVGTGHIPTTTTTPQPNTDGPIKIRTPEPYYRRGNPPIRPPLPVGFKVSSFQFSFDVTKEMMPFCRMNVYYMREQEVVAAHTRFEVEDIFENPVSMEFSKEEVRPGGALKLKLKAAPNSKIAVTAVDKSIHYLADGNDLKPEDILNLRKDMDIKKSPQSYGYWRRCEGYKRRRRSVYGGGWDDESFVDSEEAFKGVGASVMTSLRIDPRPCEIRPIIAYSLVGQSGGSSADGGPGPDAKEPTRVRKDFPETWLWLDETVQSDGTKEIDVTVPDTITSWYASAFAMSQSVGLGVAKPASLRVFQPFFISLNLPYAVVRGEEVTVPAAVFSYLDSACLSVKVSLEYSPEYEMIAGPAAKACICGGRTATVLFKIVPKALGKIPLRITAKTLDNNVCASGKSIDRSVSMADILVRKLLVEPEGVKNSYTLSSFMCPKDSPTTLFKLRKPENLVPGSIYSKVSVIGDIMGSSLSNIDKLLAMPYGCGEQNMLKFAPNIFIMNYLNNTNQVSGPIKTKALDYMRSGYQRELTYKRKDASYSAFGERDDAGSTWLSAFVLKSYAQARPWIDIDEKELISTSSWLMRQKEKKPSYCFAKSGKLHNKAMAGGVKSAATLNAYVIISLLEADIPTDHPQIQDAVYGCVAKEINSVKDSYSLALMAYMFAKVKDNVMYKRVMDRLDSMAIKEDGMTHWEEPKEKNEKANTHRWYYQARATDIEQTAYVLLALLEAGGKDVISKSVPLVRWLSKQRNDLGGWSSTQDTVLAMQSLAMFAELTYGSSLDMKIDVSSSDKTFDHSFDINSNNNLVLQQVEDIPVPGSLKIEASGDGCALVQAIVRYNEKETIPEKSFSISARVNPIKRGRLTSLRTCYSQYITICPRWLGEKRGSNMAIVDVAMVSGFEPNAKSLNKLLIQKDNDIKDIETKGRNVFIYFNTIRGDGDCFSLIVDQINVVEKMKEVPIKVYDYYDTEKSATIMYGINEDKCKGVITDIP